MDEEPHGYAIALRRSARTVINLLLARGMRQRQELGVRMALGIGRARLAFQMVSETLLLGLLAGVLALLLAHWTGRIASATLLADVEWTGSVMSRRVMVFTACVVVACALIASLAPLLHTLRDDAVTLLGVGGRTTYRRSTLRRSLVALQAMLSVLLLAGAGLFLRSLAEAGQIALGYEPARVAAFRWHTEGHEWSRERTYALYDAALERVRTLPQVEAAALSMTEPLLSRWYGYIRVPGLDSIPTTRDIIHSPVSADYCRTLGTRVLHGRAFSPQDVTGSPPVVVVTESLARVLWPGELAIGNCFMTSPEPEAVCREVVGVVEDTRYAGVLEEPSLMFYVPMAQDAGRG